MKGGRLLFGASVVLLVLVAGLILYGSAASLAVAFGSRGDQIGSISFDQLREMGAEDAVRAIRGRRVTAATWAMGYGVLFTWLVLGPYRRGERWSWWALLVSVVVPQVLSIARLLFVGTPVGTLASALLLAFGLLGLLGGAPRLFFQRIDPL